VPEPVDSALGRGEHDVPAEQTETGRDEVEHQQQGTEEHELTVVPVGYDAVEDVADEQAERDERQRLDSRNPHAQRQEPSAALEEPGKRAPGPHPQSACRARARSSACLRIRAWSPRCAQRRRLVFESWSLRSRTTSSSMLSRSPASRARSSHSMSSPTCQSVEKGPTRSSALRRASSVPGSRAGWWASAGRRRAAAAGDRSGETNSRTWPNTRSTAGSEPSAAVARSSLSRGQMSSASRNATSSPRDSSTPRLRAAA